MPPEKYFKEHPEYFSLVNGQRHERIRAALLHQPGRDPPLHRGDPRAMRAHPECHRVFRVAERLRQPLRMPEVPGSWPSEKARRWGRCCNWSTAWPRAWRRSFPIRSCETLAYQWTPASAQADASPAERGHHAVLDRMLLLPSAGHLRLRGQQGVSRRHAKPGPRSPRGLWVWDYTTDFSHYLLPFPNQHVLGPNIRFYVAHNVKGIFEEDTYDTPQSELAALGGYVMAKCLWNPNYDANRAIDEFLDGYYGKAAGPIRAYIDLLHDRVERENIHVGIYVGTDHPHLTDELLSRPTNLWQQAEGLAAAEPEMLDG